MVVCSTPGLVATLAVVFSFCHASGAGKGKGKVSQGKRDGYYLSANITFADSKREFHHEFGGFAEHMLCSGCKLTAKRWGEELSQRPEVNSTHKGQSYNAISDVMNATCTNIPDPLLGIPGESGPEFASYDEVVAFDKELAEKAMPASARSRQMAYRLCLGILREFITDLLAELARNLDSGLPLLKRWDRFLCAGKTKLCKRKDVEDDEEDSSEGHIADSLEKRRETQQRDAREFATKNLISAAISGDEKEFKLHLAKLHGQGIEIPSFIDGLLSEIKDPKAFLKDISDDELVDDDAVPRNVDEL